MLTLNTALEFVKQGHDVEVFTAEPVDDDGCLTDSNRIFQDAYEGIPVTRLRHSVTDPEPHADNPMRSEYDNRFAAQCFSDYLTKTKPGLVVCFHCRYLSASILPVCRDKGVVLFVVPTDFWFMCPLFQLRTHAGQCCDGPSPASLNCVRHLVAKTQARWISRLMAHMPDCILRGSMKLAQLVPISAMKWVDALQARGAYMKRALDAVDRLVVPNDMMAQQFEKIGFDKSRIVVLPFGVKGAPGETAEKTSSDILRIAFIGTLAEHKGPHILIEAFTAMESSDAVLKIYGDPSIFPDFSAHLKTLSGDNPKIQFLGTFPNADFARVLKEVDVLVIPSLWVENTPLVLYSAMQCRTPVIVSDTPGMDMIIDGENGWRFAMGDTEQLTEILNMLNRDKGRLESASKCIVPPLTAGQYATELLGIYNELCKQ